uniref:Uncharacterized protein n=1 Tax=Romanomermis culicivorax TaxID=13658 RepID=A0A915KSR7_ROMCU
MTKFTLFLSRQHIMSQFNRLISCTSNMTNGTESSWIFVQPHHDQNILGSLTKNVDQLVYETPAKLRHPSYSPPEFLKVFGDMQIAIGSRAVFDCMLIGNPRPKASYFPL